MTRRWLDARRLPADQALARWEARPPDTDGLIVGEGPWAEVQPVLCHDAVTGVAAVHVDSVRLGTAKVFAELLATPAVANAPELHLAALGLQAAHLKRLAKAKRPTPLRALTVEWGEFDKPLDERALRGLLETPDKAFASLESLALVGWMPLNDRLIGADPLIGRLRSLRVRASRPDWMLRWLAEQSSPLERLDTTVRGSRPLDYRGAYRDDPLPQLRTLVLDGDAQAALGSLGDAPFYGHLDVLGWRLGRDQRSDLEHLARLPPGPSTLRLVAPPGGLDPSALASLDDGPLLTGVERIDLGDTTPADGLPASVSARLG
jgi:hypothetical protein